MAISRTNKIIIILLLSSCTSESIDLEEKFRQAENALYTFENADSAMIVLDQILLVDPLHHQANQLKFGILISQNKLEQAHSMVNAGLDIAPNNPVFLMLKGAAIEKINGLEQAYKYYKKSLLHYETSAFDSVALAYLMTVVNGKNEGEKILNNVSSIDKKLYEYFRNEILSYQGTGLQDFEQPGIDLDTMFIEIFQPFGKTKELLINAGINFHRLSKIDSGYVFVAKSKYREKIDALEHKCVKLNQ